MRLPSSGGKPRHPRDSSFAAPRFSLARIRPAVAAAVRVAVRGQSALQMNVRTPATMSFPSVDSMQVECGASSVLMPITVSRSTFTDFRDMLLP